jgi:hypothetical protein
MNRHVETHKQFKFQPRVNASRALNNWLWMNKSSMTKIFLIQGEWKPSHITGKMEPTYPSWKRNFFRYCVTLPVILTSLVVVFLVMILVFEFQRWVDGMDNPPKWLKFAPKIALAVSIGKMDDIYKTVAYKLNDKGKIL